MPQRLKGHVHSWGHETLFQAVIMLTCQYRPKLLKQRGAQRPVIENGNACLLIVRQTMLPFFTLPAGLAWVTLLISVPDCSVLDKPFVQCQCRPQSSILKHLLVSGVFPVSYEKPFLCELAFIFSCLCCIVMPCFCLAL